MKNVINAHGGWFNNEVCKNKIEDLLDIININIIGVLWTDIVDYENLFRFKKEYIDSKKDFNVNDSLDLLTSEQKVVLDFYNYELWMSIYWTPPNESIDTKKKLNIWECLYFISTSIDELLKIKMI